MSNRRNFLTSLVGLFGVAWGARYAGASVAETPSDAEILQKLREITDKHALTVSDRAQLIELMKQPLPTTMKRLRPVKAQRLDYTQMPSKIHTFCYFKDFCILSSKDIQFASLKNELLISDGKRIWRMKEEEV